MSDEVEMDDDPVVKAAIQLLPVPAHGETFWDDLDRRLDEVAGPRRPAAPSESASVFALRHPEAIPAPTVDPTPVPQPRPAMSPRSELAVIPPAMHRRSNAVLAAVAVAALLVVGFAGAALVRDQSDSGGTQLADGDQSSMAKALQTATTVAPTGVPESLSSSEVKASTSAATTYAADHATGGASTKWDQVLVTPVTSGKDGGFAVVTLVGATGIETYAVRLTHDGAEVIPTDTAGTIELVSPAPAEDDGTEATVDGGDDLVVVLPAGASAPVLRLDDGTPVICGEADGTHLTAMDGMARQRCAWTPTRLAPGAHTLTVAFAGDDGTSISADSVMFQAA